MSDVAQVTTGSAASAEPGADAAKQEEAERYERRLALAFAVGLPTAAILGSVVAGALVGVGPALLILAGSALLGVVGLFWGSLRTLSGEAALPPELVEAATLGRAVGERAERKRRAVRALKDLEHEHAVGKIDDKDYETLAAELRAQAKAAMRELDEDVAPYRGKAEALVRDYLKKRGLSGAAEAGPEASTEAAPAPAVAEANVAKSSGPAGARLVCAACGADNENDARFCKKCGAALGAGEATHGGGAEERHEQA